MSEARPAARAALAVLGLALTLSGCGPLGGPMPTGEDPPVATGEAVAGAGAADAHTETTVVRSTRPRILGFLFQRTPGDVGDGRAAELAAAAAAGETDLPDAEVVTASGDPAASTGSAAAAEGPRPRGLAGFLAGVLPGGDGAAAGGGGAGEAAFDPGTELAFGEIARACGLSRAALGREIDRSPAGYRLHDTAPGSVAPRTLFLTGFRDGCARAFTASLALFGSAEVHEAMRYNPLNEAPWSPTDEAYERVKNRLCGVRRGQPCPERGLRRLQRRAAFLSVYRGFGDTAQWMEVFLDDGKLASHELRRGGRGGG